MRRRRCRGAAPTRRRSTGCPTPHPATRSTWPTSVRPARADRFGELAPRIVGDVAAIEAWWRSQDAARTPRFDLFPVACATTFGALDITNVELSQTDQRDQPRVRRDPAAARLRARLQRAREGLSRLLRRADRAVRRRAGLRPGRAARRPAGSRHGGRLPRLLRRDRERLATADRRRARARPRLRRRRRRVRPTRATSGHVCDVEHDLLTASLSDDELEAHVLDGGRDDYYGHSGSWADVQDSLFFERLDSPDRSAPTAPAALVVRRRSRSRRSSTSRGAPRATTSARSPTGSTRTAASSGGAADLGAAASTRQRRHGSYSVRAADCSRPPEPAGDGPLQAGLRDRRRAGPAAARHGPAAGDPHESRSGGRPRPRCSPGRPCAIPAACATTGSRSARGRSSSRSRRDDHARDAAHGRLGRRRRPCRQHRADDNRAAPPPALTTEGASRTGICESRSRFAPRSLKLRGS